MTWPVDEASKGVCWEEVREMGCEEGEPVPMTMRDGERSWN